MVSHPERLRRSSLGRLLWILIGAFSAASGADAADPERPQVLDPAAVALKIAEAMADLGLTHSKAGLFATPPEKTFK